MIKAATKDSEKLVKYVKYERVRISGITNMFDVERVSNLSGLSENDVIFVMKNYDDLKRKYEKRLKHILKERM